MTTVLVVDDEPQIVRALRINLSARGYRVLIAHNGATALEQAATGHPDLVILDLGLPDMDGTTVIAGLRGWSAVPIVVLSARTDSAGKVRALDAGADDYVTKPFGMDELLARVRVALRRSTKADGDQPVIQTASFTVDLAKTKVHRGEVEVHLTPTEWGVLEILARSDGKPVTHRQLRHDVWGETHADATHYLRAHTAQLRRTQRTSVEPAARRAPGCPGHLGEASLPQARPRRASRLDIHPDCRLRDAVPLA